MSPLSTVGLSRSNIAHSERPFYLSLLHISFSPWFFPWSSLRSDTGVSDLLISNISLLVLLKHNDAWPASALSLLFNFLLTFITIPEVPFMTYSKVLSIMPKESRTTMASYRHASNAPYTNTNTNANTAYTNASTSAAGQRNAAIWSTADDEILLQARASGLNWQPIATRHFPNKTANACRKRHERLVERRHVEDWDTHKLELLAEEYMACRQEMWEILASRLGERWGVIEAKASSKDIVLPMLVNH